MYLSEKKGSLLILEYAQMALRLWLHTQSYTVDGIVLIKKKNPSIKLFLFLVFIYIL